MKNTLFYCGTVNVLAILMMIWQLATDFIKHTCSLEGLNF